MFVPETGTAEYEYGAGGYGGRGYGRRRRGRRRWADQYESDETSPDEYEIDEYEADEYEPELEDGGYAAEYEPGELGADEYEADEYEADEYESDEYESDEYEADGYELEAQDEDRFLPLIPVVGKVLGGLLGGLLKETEGEYGAYSQGESGEPGEAGDAEEELLHRILGRVLGQEAEDGETGLTPAQEAELSSQLLEVADEAELARILGKVVNTVGRVYQGVSSAARSPQGRALIDALRPVAQSVLSPVGPSVVLEAESAQLDREQDELEMARRVVNLAASAARQVASAPPDAPPELVGELSVIRAASRFARPLYRRSLRAVSPFARRFVGGPHFGRRLGYRSTWPYRRRYLGPRFRRYGYGYGYRGYGFPPSAGPVPEPFPEPFPEPPGLPQPGFRWVAVPIGAPATPEPVPPSAPPPDQPPPGAPQGEFGWGSRGYGRRRSTGPSGRWIRRGGKIIVLDA